DFTGITTGMSVADLIARCGLAPHRTRNPLAWSAYQGAQAPAWGETDLSCRRFTRGEGNPVAGGTRHGHQSRALTCWMFRSEARHAVLVAFFQRELTGVEPGFVRAGRDF